MTNYAACVWAVWTIFFYFCYLVTFVKWHTVTLTRLLRICFDGNWMFFFCSCSHKMNFPPWTLDYILLHSRVICICANGQSNEFLPLPCMSRIPYTCVDEYGFYIYGTPTIFSLDGILKCINHMRGIKGPLARLYFPRLTSDTSNEQKHLRKHDNW